MNYETANSFSPAPLALACTLTRSLKTYSFPPLRLISSIALVSNVAISKMIPLPRLFFLPLLIVATVTADPSPGKTDLLAFKYSLSCSAHGALSSWNPASDPCSSWRGVSCRGGRVARLVLEGLRLDGPIHHLARLPHLSLLSLSNNSFSFPIHRLDLSLSPWQAHLKILHLSQNRFSGPFPVAFLRLRRLRRLNLAGNLISGAIPPDIGVLLRHLLTLRLEENELSGAVPTSVGSIPGLTNLNVSRNRLSGAIPSDLSYFPPSSFAANSALCGIPLQRRCPKSLAASSADPRPQPNRTPGRKLIKWTVILAATAGALAATTAAAMTALFCLRRWAKRKAERTPGVGGEEGKKEKERAQEEEEERDEQRMEWFEEESGEAATFSLEDLMQGSAEMLGRGAVGSTYRVVMEEAAVTVVVKRVRRPKRSSSKEKRRGMKEEESLLKEMGGWRHPNVVTLRAYHYSSSGEELLLVYDYLSNGSLFDLLHGNRGPGRIPLEWPSRLKLVLDAANGLSYLHGVANSKLSHHHLTSSNILVDAQGNARISDFALLDLVSSIPPPSSSSSSSFNSASSRAIAAAATATETAHRNGDVYCFGVILLEMLTGRPGGEDLAKWVQTVVREEWTSEVFDIELMRGKAAEDEMFALLQVALLCVVEEAKQRPRMGVVYKMIEDIRERGNRKSRGGEGGPISPYLQDHYSGESTSPCLSEDTPTVTSS